MADLPSARELRTPTVHVVDTRLDEHRRRVPAEPVIRLSLFTQRGTERGVDLTPDEAVRLAHALLTAHGRHARIVADRTVPVPAPTWAVCSWCDAPASALATHSDGRTYPTCGAPEHGLPGSAPRG